MTALRSLREMLPQGQGLPAAEWHRRHRFVLSVLGFLLIAIPAYGFALGFSAAHAIGDALPLVPFAALAAWDRLDRRARSILGSLGLLTGAAVIVHVSGGVIEAHFSFFVMIIIIALYEDWVPFVAAVIYTVLEHGAMGTLDPDSVYSHGGSAWKWAAIHAGFVLAAGFACIASWNFNQRVREGARRSDRRYQEIVETTAEGLCVVGPDDRIRIVNARLAEMLGYEPDSMVGRHPLDFAVRSRSDEMQLELEGMRDGVSRRWEAQLRRADGRAVWVLLSVSPQRDDDGRYEGIVAMVTDISEQKRLENELERLANEDFLTGLMNRRRFEEELERHVARAERYGNRGAVFMVDLDHFKQVNDMLGHEAGDRLLTEIGEALQRRLRRSDSIGRLGGDEFAVIAPKCDRAQAETLAAAVLGEASDAVANVLARSPDPVPGDLVSPTLSIGIVLLEDLPKLGADEALQAADVAMYRAKEDGGNGYRVFDESGPATDEFIASSRLG